MLTVEKFFITWVNVEWQMPPRFDEMSASVTFWRTIGVLVEYARVAAEVVGTATLTASPSATAVRTTTRRTRRMMWFMSVTRASSG